MNDELPISGSNKLVASLNGIEKSRVVEAITTYRVDPCPVPAHRHSGDGWITWGRGAWDNLFAYRLPSDEALFLQYWPRTLWVYRGWYNVTVDLMGPNEIVCRDQLKCVYPVFSSKTLDTEKTGAYIP